MDHEEIFDNGRYVGELLNGEIHGYGTYYWNSGTKYCGQFKYGKKDGKGTFYYANGDRFEGIFKQDEKSSGTYYYSNGDFCKASLVNDKYEGPAIVYIKETGATINCTFKDGKRTGPANVTYDNGAKMECTYKNEHENGPFVYYDINGGKEEGIFVDSKRNGPAKITFPTGNVLEFVYKNDVMEGNAIAKWPSGDWQKRKYKNDILCSVMYGVKANGAIIAARRFKAMSYSAVIEGSTYIGYAMDKDDIKGKNGRGTIYNADGTIEYGEWKNSELVLKLHNPMLPLEEYTPNNYKGKIKNGTFNGKGTYIYPSGDKFEGRWENGKRCGRGKITFTNGDIFEGEFVEDAPCGKGIFKYYIGDIYEGNYINGSKQGKGKFVFNTGDVYEGDFKQDNFEGMGTLTFVDGEKYVGEFKNWGFNGYGTYIYNNGDIYFGEFVNCCKAGEGVLFCKEGRKIGTWENDKLTKKKILHSDNFLQMLEKNVIVQRYFKGNVYGKAFVAEAKKHRKYEKYKNYYMGAMHGNKKAIKILSKDKSKHSLYFYAKYLDDICFDANIVMQKYIEAGKKKSVFALSHLAEMYEKGIGVESNIPVAKEYYEKLIKVKTKEAAELDEKSKACDRYDSNSIFLVAGLMGHVGTVKTVTIIDKNGNVVK